MNWHGLIFCHDCSGQQEWESTSCCMDTWHVARLLCKHMARRFPLPSWQQERVSCYMNDGHATKLLYERLACNQAVYIWTFDMWWSCYTDERLACDEAAVIWRSGMWRNCYISDAWRGFVLYHGCYKGRWNSATLMNFWPARPFSFAMFAVITKNEGTIIWTSGMAFSFLLGIMPVSLFAAVLLFSIESVCCVWYLRGARKQGIRGQSRRSNTFYLYSKLPQTRV